MPKKEKYVIVRTYSAGVHAGTLVSQKGKEVVLMNTRRIWYWKGAASLSEMAVSGVIGGITGAASGLLSFLTLAN